MTRGRLKRAQSYLAGSIVTDWMSAFNSLDGVFSQNLKISPPFSTSGLAIP